ncbi:MAG: beta-phosphoglucomutase family hydrolase [Chlorobi bacterium]|nr:beta-phosphoglucomutase family hydrolase [Chlorobiota bacterium]
MQKHPFEAVIFDLDGVITKTATTHSHAWKKMFDDYLRYREEKYGEPFREFTTEDYLRYVDGKPRYDGVKSFLDSRNIKLPFGTPEDMPDMETVCGLGNRKNNAFNEVLKKEGVEVYPSTVKLLEQLKKEGVRIGVASSSKNAESVLKAAGLMRFIETRVDGVVSAELGLTGKPAPDIFVTAAKNLGADPALSVVVEDATSGVQAGRNGNFGLVLGLAREDNFQTLKANGADIVVRDMEEITIEDLDRWFKEGIEEDNWKLAYHDYDPAKEKSREALLTVGNGFFGTRGAMEETEAGKTNYPGTYIAGLYNRLVTKVAGRDVENEDFVNGSNWLSLTFQLNDGPWFDPNDAVIEEISRTLDFRNGLLKRSMVVTDKKGRKTKIVSYRLASMADMHVAALKYQVTPLNYSEKIRFKSALEGKHKNAGVERYNSLNQQHLEPVEQGGQGSTSFLKVRTTQSKIEIIEAARLQLRVNGFDKDTDFEITTDVGVVETFFGADTHEGETLEVEKVVHINTSQFGETDLVRQTLWSVENASSFDELLRDSADAWKDIWQETDVRVKDDRISQKLLRMHIYHLMVSASPHNVKLDASVTARGLHGEAYRGHIFWDELFILPFYNIHFPDIAKALLMYRYRRLDKAREYAAENGYKGAMFPWQSGSDGREETQVLHLNPVTGEWGPDHSSLQRHVSLAVAYNVWQYFNTTADAEFLKHYGAEMYFEICRFWASIAKFDPQTGRYSIEGVMGPDEFHEMYPGAKKGGLKDNAYTNMMVSWMFGMVPEILKVIGGEGRKKVFKKISLQQDEIEKWDDVRRKLRLIISEDGIISQYDGYFDLKELDWDYYREKYGNIHRMDRLLKAEGKSADEYKVAKQADALMTFYNLDKEEVDRLLSEMNYQLPVDYLEKNLKYYLARTSHGSTLSRIVHAQLANMIGDDQLSWELYFDALTSDYNDIQGGTTAEGIHAGVMAGTIMIAISTYAGVDIRGEVLKVNPHLPGRWKEMKFNLRFKGVHYDFEITADAVKGNADKEVLVVVNGKEYKISNGGRVVAHQ